MILLTNKTNTAIPATHLITHSRLCLCINKREREEEESERGEENMQKLCVKIAKFLVSSW